MLAQRRAALDWWDEELNGIIKPGPGRRKGSKNSPKKVLEPALDSDAIGTTPPAVPSPD
jgi:hypothetical protein